MNAKAKPATKKPPSERLYRLREIDVAMSFCPPIYPCKTCGNPVARGYRCRYCDEGSP